VIQIVFGCTGNHSAAEAPGLQRDKGVFFAPHPADCIEIFGTDGRIRLEPDISLRLHEGKNGIVILFDRLTVCSDAATPPETAATRPALGVRTVGNRKKVPHDLLSSFGKNADQQRSVG